MEDYFGLIVFVIIVLFSLLGGRKKPPQPPAPPPRQRLPDERDAERPRAEYTSPYGTAEPQAEADSAQDMVPADLWELLTGEKRVPERPQPRQEEEPVSSWDAPPGTDYRRDEPDDEPVASPWQPPQEPDYPVRLPDPPRAHEPPDRPPPVIVSLEDVDPTWRQARELHRREAALRRTRERMKQLTPVKARTVERSPLHQLLTGRDDLQRAIMLREVLGPPKGLED